MRAAILLACITFAGTACFFNGAAFARDVGMVKVSNGAAAILVAALTGCAQAPTTAATTPVTFAVLPEADGHVGAVVVEREGKREVVNTAYGAARVGADGSTQPVRLSEEQVRKDFGPTLA